MQIRRKYSSSGHHAAAIINGFIALLLSIAILITIPPVKDHLSSALTNMVSNLNAS
ncbi:hypothetical protein BH10PSE14_BH10PSE14_40750 [soil metagenome]